MRRRLGQGRWVWRAAALAVAVLTLGIGFCLFDGVQGVTHHPGMSPDLSQDLCCGLVVSGVALTLLALGPTSSMAVESPPAVGGVPKGGAGGPTGPAVYVTSLRGIDPPPELLALS